MQKNLSRTTVTIIRKVVLLAFICLVVFAEHKFYEKRTTETENVFQYMSENEQLEFTEIGHGQFAKLVRLNSEVGATEKILIIYYDTSYHSDFLSGSEWKFGNVFTNTVWESNRFLHYYEDGKHQIHFTGYTIVDLS